MSTSTPTRFVFNRNYQDLDQVAHLWDAYQARYQELTAAGRYPYDADFKGAIDGLDADDKNEDTAIYLLQSTRRAHEFDARVQDLHFRGFTAPELSPTTKPDTVVETRYTQVALIRRIYQHGRDGEIQVLDAARVRTRNGRVIEVMPKGARTRGHTIGTRDDTTTVLVKP